MPVAAVLASMHADGYERKRAVRSLVTADDALSDRPLAFGWRPTPVFPEAGRIPWTHAGFDPAAAADAATTAILADLAETGHRAMVVDSPPGAGKRTLVVRAAGDLVEGGERPIMVAR